MTGRVDEVQATVDTCVLDMAITHGSKFLAKIRAVLVLDVLDNWVPAEWHDFSVQVDKTVARPEVDTYQPSLLIWSPYPGVSTMLRRSLTPFSAMTTQILGQVK